MAAGAIDWADVADLAGLRDLEEQLAARIVAAIERGDWAEYVNLKAEYSGLVADQMPPAEARCTPPERAQRSGPAGV